MSLMLMPHLFLPPPSPLFYEFPFCSDTCSTDNATATAAAAAAATTTIIFFFNIARSHVCKKVPKVPGMEKFKGSILHTSEYKERSILKVPPPVQCLPTTVLMFSCTHVLMYRIYCYNLEAIGHSSGLTGFSGSAGHLEVAGSLLSCTLC